MTPEFMSNVIGTALCSDPKMLVKMAEHLESVLNDIRDPSTGCDQVWTGDDQLVLVAFIESARYHAKESTWDKPELVN